MQIYEELTARGLVAQCTDEKAVRTLLNCGNVTFYIGFDPTADSLHVGHMLQLIVMSRLQKAGHRPIALLGGGTTMVGDPTGKTEMRKMLTAEQIAHNADCFKRQMQNLVDFSDDGGAIMVNNADWLKKLNYIEFLRDVGRHFSVNRMLTAECFKARLEKGLSFIEFNYMLMQSYDFLVLSNEYGCKMQLGGDDQWSNILGGIDLIRRTKSEEVYGLTFTLLTTSEGKKMGKTEKGAVWLDPDKTSPYDFFQYWRNVADADVLRMLKMLTFVPLEEIAGYEGLTGSALNAVKERLAFEITAIVHGAQEAQKARDAAKSLFAVGAGGAGDMPSTTVCLRDGAIGALELLVGCGLCASNGEARRLILQGGVEIAGQRVQDPACRYTAEDFSPDGLVIKKGKKVWHRALL